MENICGSGSCQKIEELEKQIESLYEELARIRLRTTVLAYASGVLTEDAVLSCTPGEWADLLSENNFLPSAVIMTADTADVDERLYNETVSRGFLTSGDVMKMFSFSRQGAINAMRRVASLHNDVIFAKRKTRNNSARRVWILEHTEHMSTVAVKGFGFA